MKKILLFLSFLLMSIGVWGATYSLTQVTSVSAGNKYVFVESGHALTTVSSKKILSTTSYLMSGLSGNEAYVWLLESSTKGYYLKNCSDSKYLSSEPGKSNMSSSTGVGDTWTFSFTSNVALIQDYDNANRFIGNNGTYEYKAYAESNLDNYNHDIIVYRLDVGTAKYAVNWLANNDTIYKDSVQVSCSADIPNVNINDYCDDIFVGWTDVQYEGTTPPAKLFITSSPTITKDTTFYAVFGNYENGNIISFFKTKLNKITTSDVFVIVGEKDGEYYAMSNNNGTTSAPDGISVTPINDYILSPVSTILWNLIGNNTDGYTFYPNNDSTKWLYCSTKASSGSNNNLRVGDSERNTFILNNDGYFETKDSYTKRYIGVYTDNPDWRSYTSYSGQSNIAGQTFEFYKGTRTIDEYHTNTDCVRKFNNAQNDSLWTTKGNWTNNKIPTIKYGARIDTAVIVDTTHAVAKHVIINQNTGNGKIIIQPNKGLEVDSTIVVSKNNSYHPTTPNDLILESSDEGNASLIFNNNNQNSATVNLYSKATNPGLDGFNADWQYVGTTMTSLNALYNYYGSWLYEWVGGDEKWRAVPNGGTMEAWNGYCITQGEAACHETSGQLVPTTTKTLDIYAPYTVVANSWTAPIHIGAFRDADFNNVSDNRIYLFNTGFDPGGDSAVYTTMHNSPGTYVVIPIHAAPYLDKDSLIPSQQGFFVKTSTNGHLILDYDRIVRTGGSGDIVAGPLRAPRRAAADDKPNVLKIYANGSRFSDRLTILEREDFTTSLDNGWDGDKMGFSNLAPSIYVINEDGSYDEVSAIPDYEGTLIGFKAGTDIAYSITFDYDGDETIYLNDMLAQTSTLIDNESKYVFTSDGSEEVRFVISATPYAGVATDIDELTEQSSTTHKFLYNGNLYILKNNCIFNVVGSLVK